MITSIHIKRRGFTLVELLTVIAIIGILAAILIPTVGGVMKRANMTKASNNARQIALAYNTYAMDGARTRVISKGAWTPTNPRQANGTQDWAAVLATFADLNDASFYYIDSDTSLLKTPPTTVLVGTGSEATKNPDWLDGEDGKPAWALVLNSPRGASTSVTPLLWTRGWGDEEATINNGWGPKSPWGTDGGHIAFLDAHVVWMRSTSDESASGDLVNNTATSDKGKATSDLLLAAGVEGEGATEVLNEEN